MKGCSWKTISELLSADATQEDGGGVIKETCPCSCLQRMVQALDTASPAEALLQVQGCLSDIMGELLLSLYRKIPGQDALELAATGHTADDASARIRLPLLTGSVAAAVLSDGAVRWVSCRENDVSAVAMAPLIDHGQPGGLLIAEFSGNNSGCGKPSSICLRCAAAVLRVSLLSMRIGEAQQDLFMLARYRSTAELTVQVTHDINNMMQGVLGNATLARMDAAGNDPVMEALAAIEQAARRASALSRKLLNFARDDATGGTGCDAVQSSSDAVELAETLYLKGVPVTRTIPDHALAVQIKENDLQTVLIMLIKAGTLTLRPVTGAALAIDDAPSNSQVHVHLTVKGVRQEISGGDQTEAQRLTAAARELAAQSGCMVSIDSQPDAGSVALILPVSIAKHYAPDRRAHPGASPAGVSRILVIGGSSPLPLLLSAAGCTVQSADSWDNAAQLVRTARSQAVLAVIENETDLHAAVQGRRLLGIPVIAACVANVVCPADLAASLDGVLGLPMDLDDLRRMLARVLH